MRESETSLRPIGVFDSGIGGLTVVRALRDLLPHEDIFYIGDTARLPYGGKSKSTIERYSIEISGLLLAENAKMIVVACNTSSSLAISKLQEILKSAPRPPVAKIDLVHEGLKAVEDQLKDMRTLNDPKGLYSRFPAGIHWN